MLKLTKRPESLVILILDGWGVAQDSPGNAITHAKLPNFNSLWYSYPHAVLATAGQSVGLPEGQVGNSEVGHLNLGAGRIVFQDLLRINMSIADGTFYENEAFKMAIDHIQKYESKIHLLGLIGLGSVHSEKEHLYALLGFLNREKIPQSRIKLHLFTDGRDSPPTSARFYLDEIQKKVKSANLGEIASISGRYFAMDRDNRWDRTEKAYRAIIGQGENTARDAINAVEKSYNDGKTDEFIEPVIMVDESNVPIGPVCENDAVIFFNFRPDRTRQLTKAFVLDNLSQIKTSSDELIAAFNRGIEQPFRGEDRILVDSPKVASYDLIPQMSTPEISKRLIEKINLRQFEFIVANFANADMVAHTGKFDATVKSVEAIDQELGKIINTVLTHGGAIVVTSDHGNAEELINLRTGEVDTEHNINPAPCIFVFSELKGKSTIFPQGLLADCAPSVLALMQIPKPSHMTGRSLL